MIDQAGGATERAPAPGAHADTITCLRNSGAQRSERRDNALLARPGRTEAGPGAGDQAAAVVDAANEPSTRTEHLCRVREAHRVSSRRATRAVPIAAPFTFQRIGTRIRARGEEVVPRRRDRFRRTADVPRRARISVSQIRVSRLLRS